MKVFGIRFLLWEPLFLDLKCVSVSSMIFMIKTETPLND